MSRLARALDAIRYLAGVRASPHECGTDRPASFAEIIAASAFLDFGGMPSGDWLHAWEASMEHDRRLKDEESPPTQAMPQTALGNKRIGKSLDQGKTIFGPRQSQHAAFDFTGDNAFLFRSPDRRLMLLVDKSNGQFQMRVDGEPRTLDVAMCVAAFGFIAGLLAFAHPTFPVSRTSSATAQAAAAETPAPYETTLTRLGAPR
jgi:hypothetical protein